MKYSILLSHFSPSSFYPLKTSENLWYDVWKPKGILLKKVINNATLFSQRLSPKFASNIKCLLTLLSLK